MAVSIDATYTGALHCRLVHGPSGAALETDAPKDNAGKGEAFSPTDLLGAALVSCALTTMAIKAPKEDIVLEAAEGRVEKHMTVEGPRRVAGLRADLRLPASLSPDHRARLEAIARSCPVALSLSSDVEIDFRFSYGGP
jgi:putative redox protein